MKQSDLLVFLLCTFLRVHNLFAFEAGTSRCANQLKTATGDVAAVHVVDALLGRELIHLRALYPFYIPVIKESALTEKTVKIGYPSLENLLNAVEIALGPTLRTDPQRKRLSENIDLLRSASRQGAQIVPAVFEIKDEGAHISLPGKGTALHIRYPIFISLNVNVSLEQVIHELDHAAEYAKILTTE